MSPEAPPPAPLRLLRPLVALDIETTGLDVTADRIVEVAAVKLLPDGRRVTWERRVNPGVPIGAAATRVHGIRDADVATAPHFAELAPALAAFVADADLTGFNIEQFDLPLLRHEFARVGVSFPGPGVHVVDSFRIFLRQEPRDLAAAHRLYCHAPLQDAHSAGADARAAADILLAQVARYGELPREVAALQAWCHPRRPDWIDPDGKIVWRDDDAVLTFGKHRHRPLRRLVAEEPDYLRWVAGANFSPAVAQICRDALAGNLPQRPPAAAQEPVTP